MKETPLHDHLSTGKFYDVEKLQEEEEREEVSLGYLAFTRAITPSFSFQSEAKMREQQAEERNKKRPSGVSEEFVDTSDKNGDD